jgi:hypothetical protein
MVHIFLKIEPLIILKIWAIFFIKIELDTHNYASHKYYLAAMAAVDYSFVDLIFPLQEIDASVRGPYVVLLKTIHAEGYAIESIVNGLKACLRWVEASRANCSDHHAHLRCLLELLGVEAINIALHGGSKLAVYNRICRTINEKFRNAAASNRPFFEANRGLIKRVTKMYTPFD